MSATPNLSKKDPSTMGIGRGRPCPPLDLEIIDKKSFFFNFAGCHPLIVSAFYMTVSLAYNSVPPESNYP